MQYTDPWSTVQHTDPWSTVQLTDPWSTVQHLLPSPLLQVLHLAASLAPNQDIAFMLSIAWTAVRP